MNAVRMLDTAMLWVVCGRGHVLGTACGAGGLRVRARAGHSLRCANFAGTGASWARLAVRLVASTVACCARYGVKRCVARAGVVSYVAIGQPDGHQQ